MQAKTIAALAVVFLSATTQAVQCTWRCQCQNRPDSNGFPDTQTCCGQAGVAIDGDGFCGPVSLDGYKACCESLPDNGGPLCIHVSDPCDP
ncbi:hypothetical protein GQ53DRAFT_755373 [Thozetella sp. PMI_491]|nr:hypothetical protein GQ53DRAFT_755373 [Thozetella sp. PMI_491]